MRSLVAFLLTLVACLASAGCFLLRNVFVCPMSNLRVGRGAKDGQQDMALCRPEAWYNVVDVRKAQ